MYSPHSEFVSESTMDSSRTVSGVKVIFSDFLLEDGLRNRLAIFALVKLPLGSG